MPLSPSALCSCRGGPAEAPPQRRCQPSPGGRGLSPAGTRPRDTAPRPRGRRRLSPAASGQRELRDVFGKQGGNSAAHAAPSRPFPARPAPLPGRAVPSQKPSLGGLAAHPRAAMSRGAARPAESGGRSTGRGSGRTAGRAPGRERQHHPTGARSDPAPRNTVQRDWRVPSVALRQSWSSLFLGGRGAGREV